MPPKDARYHRERRSGVKKDKEEKRRLAKERGIESRARKRAFATVLLTSLVPDSPT